MYKETRKIILALLSGEISEWEVGGRPRKIREGYYKRTYKDQVISSLQKQNETVKQRR